MENIYPNEIIEELIDKELEDKFDMLINDERISDAAKKELRYLKAMCIYYGFYFLNPVSA